MMMVVSSWVLAVVFVALSGGMPSGGVSYLVVAKELSSLLLGLRGSAPLTVATIVVGTLMWLINPILGETF